MAISFIVVRSSHFQSECRNMLLKSQVKIAATYNWELVNVKVLKSDTSSFSKKKISGRL